MLKTRSFDFDVRSEGDSGSFSGYASVYNVIDSYREVVAPGAFASTLRKWQAKGRLPPVLWQHSAKDPIGAFTKMAEDSKGLHVEGRLLVRDVGRAKEAQALIRAGAISGLSIGFNSITEEWNSETKLLTLKEVDLWEASIVTFPANDAARVESVKSTPRNLERALREQLGFSNREARRLVNGGFKALAGEDEDDESPEINAIAAELRSLETQLRGE